MWWFIAIWIIVTVAIYFFMPKPEAQKPPAVGEIEVTTAEDGREITVLFGTRDFSDMNVVWYGDVTTEEKTIPGGGKK